MAKYKRKKSWTKNNKSHSFKNRLFNFYKSSKTGMLMNYIFCAAFIYICICATINIWFALIGYTIPFIILLFIRKVEKEIDPAYVEAGYEAALVWGTLFLYVFFAAIWIVAATIIGLVCLFFIPFTESVAALLIYSGVMIPALFFLYRIIDNNKKTK